MRTHSSFRLPRGRIISVMLIVAAVSVLASCGDITGTSKPETPTQVVEAFYNGLDEDDCNEALQYLDLEYEGLREIEVFIRNTASQGEIESLGEEIRSMVEVETVYFMSKEEALERMREQMRESGMSDAMVREQLGENLPIPPVNPLPASFQITLRDLDDTKEVASRFFENPTVDNTPGSGDGVKYVRNPDIEGLEGFVSISCRSVLSEYDYEISEFSVVDESIDDDEATVTFSAVASIDGIESTPDEFNMKLHKSGDAWKIDFFKSLRSMKGAPGIPSILLINNEAQAEKIGGDF